ncbi:MAG: Rieske 2Fe-2S domain-containing protein [Candidatus Lustribacter sp.]|jgi:phenylpropionate dioxygenase-like ring-hydroxylating dioxygenase large terminal subunit
MLSREDNELLVRVGPGTAMGEFFRRFWTPVMLAEELGGPDSAPVRVNVLGEKFVAFRDTAGTIGLLDAYCPHRRANMFWGRNEEAGLRCVYHGWKFDVDGRCTDLPNCPEGVTLKDRVRTRAFPTLERGGLIWAYFGPPDRKPEFPNYEGFHAPPSHRYIRKMISRGNYLQLMEGDVDSSHVGFLHRHIDDKLPPGSRVNPNTFRDSMPRWFTQETNYGLMLSAQRNAGPDHFQWRVNQFLMPSITLIASQPGMAILHQVRVPIDDETTLHFRCYINPDRPLTADELAVYNAGWLVPDTDPETFQTIENVDNDYLIDRDVQRTSTYTGIKSVVAQDLAVTQDQDGLIADRSREYLVSSDRAIIVLRQRLLAAAKALQRGIEPPETRNTNYAVRPGDFILARDVPVEQGARELQLVGDGQHR